ncbi:MAG: hypothetical protein H6819_04980 [Phycisphaerales bacterium]|nr:hypothetical protein [Phycisphaerales bacterium]MCB9854866.1 hypothetical protein [Phycisphaerales bacterium]
MKGRKIALVVGCLLLAAGIVYFFWGEDDEVPTQNQATTNWKCDACGHLFKLTDDEFYKELVASPTGNAPLICPKCQKRDAWMVALCPKCNEWYYGIGKPGATGMCPRCSPPPKEETIVDDSGSESKRRTISNY